MLNVNKLQIASLIIGAALFAVAYFTREDLALFILFAISGFGFAVVAFFLRNKPIPQTVIEENVVNQEVIAPKPEPQYTEQPKPTLTLQEHLGNVLDRYFDYRGQIINVDSDIVVEIEGSQEAAQTKPAKSNPHEQAVEYKPIED